MRKHSPSPWSVSESYNDNHEIQSHIVDNNQYVIASLQIWKGNAIYETEANARLISAAPDLAEALRLLVKRLDNHFGGRNKSYDWQEQEKARSVLAKAGIE